MTKESSPPDSDVEWQLYFKWRNSLSAEQIDNLDKGILPEGTPPIYLILSRNLTVADKLIYRVMGIYPSMELVLDRTEEHVELLNRFVRAIVAEFTDDPLLKGKLTLEDDIDKLPPSD